MRGKHIEVSNICSRSHSSALHHVFKPYAVYFVFKIRPTFVQLLHVITLQQITLEVLHPDCWYLFRSLIACLHNGHLLPICPDVDGRAVRGVNQRDVLAYMIPFQVIHQNAVSQKCCQVDAIVRLVNLGILHFGIFPRALPLPSDVGNKLPLPGE